MHMAARSGGGGGTKLSSGDDHNVEGINIYA